MDANAGPERMTREEMERAYDGEWVLIDRPETDAAMRVVSGVVVAHSPDRVAAWESAERMTPPHDCAFLYMGRPIPRKSEVWL